MLEIDGRRSFGYESVYFDTPQLSTYRAHLQRRRQRFKARTRTYTDSGLCMFEVKLTGARGETVKQRVPYPTEHRAELTERGAGPPRRRPLRGLPPGPAGRAAADAGHHLPAHHLRLPHRGDPADLRRRAGLPATAEHEVRDTGTHVLVESKSSAAGQRGGPDPARARRAPGHGQQVLRRRRRPAPRAAVQPLAPDAAALLRAAAGRRLTVPDPRRSTSSADPARRRCHPCRAGGAGGLQPRRPTRRPPALPPSRLPP